MDKRYLRWILPVALISFLAALLYTRADLRSFFTFDYWQNVARYARVLRIVESEYARAADINFEVFTDVALREAVRSLDRHSDYMVAQDYKEFNMASNREYVGVGIELRQFSGRVVITEVFPQGAAQEAGLLSGDFIVGIGDVDTRDKDIGSVVDLIKGEPGSSVSMHIQRPLEDMILTFEMERRAISLDSVVDVGMLSDRVGYLKIRQFIDETDLELTEALDTLKQSGMAGLIVDLRQNPGGRLDTAARMAEIFLEEGLKVLTVQSRRGVEDVFISRGSDNPYEGSMIVLIDGESASASEILAGALRDHSRALLVGQKTYGKGSVQSVYGFKGGDGLKLTTAHYLLPDGEAINGVGVYPDVEVAVDPVDAMTLVLQKHHLRRMGPELFEQSFGFAPVEDEPLAVALAMFEAALTLE